MKIALQTWGSEGDINPFIALARGLVQQGHDVSLAITSAHRKDYAQDAKNYGFTLYKVDYIGENEEALEKIAIRLFQKMDPIQQMKIVADEMLEPSIDSCYRTALELCGTHELIIGHFFLHAVEIAAEKTQTPYISITQNHGTIPSCYAPPAGMPNLGRWMNSMLWRLTTFMINKISLPSINRLRLHARLEAASSYRQVWESKLCNLVTVSPLLFLPRPDWDSYQKPCGLLQLPLEANDWQMPEDLQTFLNQGTPPIYMTFGSMTGIQIHHEEAFAAAQLMQEAALLAGCRAIIQAPWNIISGVMENERIFRIDRSPYAKTFPHCSVIVHHGGSGTTQAALLAGKPSVVVTHITDQTLFGYELERLGVATKRLARQKITPKELAKAIKTVLQHPEMQINAQKLGQQLEKEDSLKSAIHFIEEIIKTIESPEN